MYSYILNGQEESFHLGDLVIYKLNKFSIK
jgi:hypothetical protein